MNGKETEIRIEFDEPIEPSKLENKTLIITVNHFPAKIKFIDRTGKTRKLIIDAKEKNNEIKFQLT